MTGSEEVVKKLVECGVNKKNIFILKEQKWFDLGLIQAKLDKLEHDTPNYALHFQYELKKGLYVVDTASVENIDAKDYNLYLVENNYQEEILEKHIQECMESNDNEDKLFYLNRVKSTHLSSSKCNDFLINNMGSDSNYEYIHKSNFNFKEE